MTPATFSPQDEAARLRIRESLDENLFVEAGAGTGKTTSLVERVVGLVSTGRATLDKIAAITFTESAAAELRDRIRESLEQAAEDLDRKEEERNRCRQGAYDLDQASLQTLHSFAAGILQERPIEAGLTPSFEVMDPISGELAFEEAWNRWLDAALEDPELTPHLSMAFALGLTPNQLREVAVRFHNEYDQLAAVVFDDSPSVDPLVLKELTGAAPELKRLCDFSQLRDSDPLFNHTQNLLGAIRRLSDVVEGSVAAYRRLGGALPIKCGRGSATNWSPDPVSGVNACRRLKGLLEELDGRANEELSLLRRQVLMPLLRSLQTAVLGWAFERKRLGRAQFHDLLVWTRDLLRDNLEVRDYYRSRYSHLLIDEAQDTDPLQAEIAMFLAEGGVESMPKESRPRTWEDIRPEPGKLFVVGDPKQSIYRFRRADVEQMKILQDHLEGDTVQLVQNFRSQKPVVTWVNHVFARWMGEGGFQTGYVPVEHRWEAATDHPAGPKVWSLGGRLDERRIDPVRQKEAQAIASLLGEMVRAEWQVLDAQASQETEQECYRPVRYSDICILMPRRTGLWVLELSLDQAELPYRLEGASLIFATQEVRDLINCLRAIDDPADQVALVAALRSPAFACSDPDLLDFVGQGGRFNYLSPGNAAEGRVSECLGSLRKYHQDRLWSSIANLVEGFLRERLLMEAALDHPRTREQWRRYRFMVEQARAFAGAGGNSLRTFLEWVDTQTEEKARVTEVPVPEGDEESVRVMTVHAAKGLEFPVVVLTGLNAESSLPVDRVLFDRQSGGAELRVGPTGSACETGGYEELSQWERQMADAEYVRLLYVDTTRARDHLVLSLYRSSRDDKSAAVTIDRFLKGEEQLWEQLGEVPLKLPEASAPSQPTEVPEGHTLESRDKWVQQRQETLQKQSRPVSVGATTLAQIAKEESGSEEPWRRGRGGTSLGRAVHAVLQTVDLATGAGLKETARAQAIAEGLPQREEEVLALARVALESQVVKRAVASGKLWREVPVAAPLEGGVVEGFIDLLFEEEDGLVVVDYKTDTLGVAQTTDAADRYRIQGGAYALALQQVTGKPVKEVVFLFLQPRREEILRHVANLQAEAEIATGNYFAYSASSERQ